MASHLRDGKFESDKYSVWRDGDCVTADKLVLSFHDRRAVCAIKLFAASTADADLAADIKTRLRVIENEILTKETK